MLLIKLYIYTLAAIVAAGLVGGALEWAINHVSVL